MKTSIPPKHEHPFAPYVRILGKGKKGSRSFSEEEAYEAMGMIMRGQVEDVQLGAFLMLLRVKEESADELVGFARAVRESIKPPAPLPGINLDWSSYAGKRRHLPWYLLAILLLAGQGTRIFIHGASGHTIDRVYTEDLLVELGFPIATSWEECAAQVKQQNFCYFPLRYLSPELHRIIELRNTLGLRSPVHTLARLLNPNDSEYVMQGIFHPGYRPVHQEAALTLGYKNVAVIKGEAGEIERNPDANCLVQWVRYGNLCDEAWPPMFPKRHLKEDSLDINVLRQVWRGESEHEYGEAAVIGTVAIALKLLQQAAEQETALALATDMWQQRDKGRL